MDISVVIPLLNEQESLTELHHWISSVMKSNGFSYEILFIDDGSTDQSWQTICTLKEQDKKKLQSQFVNTRTSGRYVPSFSRP